MQKEGGPCPPIIKHFPFPLAAPSGGAISAPGGIGGLGVYVLGLWPCWRLSRFICASSRPRSRRRRSSSSCRHSSWRSFSFFSSLQAGLGVRGAPKTHPMEPQGQGDKPRALWELGDTRVARAMMAVGQPQGIVGEEENITGELQANVAAPEHHGK